MGGVYAAGIRTVTMAAPVKANGDDDGDELRSNRFRLIIDGNPAFDAKQRAVMRSVATTLGRLTRCLCGSNVPLPEPYILNADHAGFSAVLFRCPALSEYFFENESGSDAFASEMALAYVKTPSLDRLITVDVQNGAISVRSGRDLCAAAFAELNADELGTAPQQPLDTTGPYQQKVVLPKTTFGRALLAFTVVFPLVCLAVNLW